MFGWFNRSKKEAAPKRCNSRGSNPPAPEGYKRSAVPSPAPPAPPFSTSFNKLSESVSSLGETVSNMSATLEMHANRDMRVVDIASKVSFGELDPKLGMLEILKLYSSKEQA